MREDDDLIKLIEEIQKRLEQGVYRNETDVREAIVLPVLQKLKWDITNPDQISREFDLKGTRVDYALFIAGAQAPHVIIEVKAVGRTVDADQQLFQYAFFAGAPLAILTDGRKWLFYYSYGTGNYSERLVRTLNLSEMRSEEVDEYLRRYLGFQEIHSKRAIKNAKKDLEDKAEKEPANQSIPKVWKQAVDEPDDQLVQFLVNKTAQESGGISPDRKNVIKFLRDLTPPSGPQHPPPKPDPINRSDEPTSHSPSEGKITYTLFGDHYEPINAIEGYKHIIKEIGARDPGFLKKLEPEFIGKQGTKHLSRRKEDMRHAFVHIGSGWYLNTNISNTQKKRLLKVACRVAGITFGRDLKINCPAH